MTCLKISSVISEEHKWQNEILVVKENSAKYHQRYVM